MALSKTKRTIGAVTLLAAAAGLITMPSLTKADEAFNYFTTISIGGLTSFDISWVDPALQTYFLADRSNKSIDTIATTTKQLSFITPGFKGIFTSSSGAVNNDLSGPNGVLTFNNTTAGTSEIWAGDGPQPASICGANTPSTGCSTLKVMSWPSGTLTHNISTGGAARADELCHDPVHHTILIANDAEADFPFGTPFVSFFSTDTYQRVGAISIPEATNGIEQCQYDNVTNLFYLNIPEVNGPGNDSKDGAVYVISPTSFTVVKKYDIPVASCAGPQGMALGPANQILLGCHGASDAIIDRTSGAVIATGFIGAGGADQVWFNPTDSHYYITATTANPASLGIVDALTGPVDQVIAIPKFGGVSPHSVAADANTNQIYMPNAGGVNIFFPSGTDSDDGATPPQPE